MVSHRNQFRLFGSSIAPTSLYLMCSARHTVVRTGVLWSDQRGEREKREMFLLSWLKNRNKICSLLV